MSTGSIGTSLFFEEEPSSSSCNFGSCWNGFGAFLDNNNRSRSNDSPIDEAAMIRKQYCKRYGEDDDDEYIDDEEDIGVSMGKEFAKLSVKERDTITEEIHGVVTPAQQSQYSRSGSASRDCMHKQHHVDGDDEDQDEPSYFVNDRINLLQDELKKIPNKDKVDYKRACFLAPTKYGFNNDCTSIGGDGGRHDASFATESKKFYVMFLRSTRYDVKLAAHKIVSFFKLKTRLFGADMVAKDITYDDLGDAERNALLTLNTSMFLPLPDMSGRKILYGSGFDVDNVTPEEKARAEFYMIMKEITQPGSNIQKDGVIAITYDVGHSFYRQSQSVIKIIADVYIYLPFKFTSFHYCYSNPAFRVTFSIFFRLLRKYVGARFREHYGQSHMEVQVRTSFSIYTINRPPSPRPAAAAAALRDLRSCKVEASSRV